MSEEEYGLKDGFITYHGTTLSDEEVVKTLNDLNYHRKRHKKEKEEQMKINEACLDVIWGFKSYYKLKREGYFE